MVQAKSAAGDRVLVVLEDDGERNLYSQFWADLECKIYPKNNSKWAWKANGWTV